MEEENRGKKFLVLLMIVAAAYLFITYSKDFDFFESDNDLKNIQQQNELSTTTQNNQANDSTNMSTSPIIEITQNKCNSKTFGLPDYGGTSKEGKTCKDAVPSEMDLECVANPPLNYDGDIVGTKSNPLIKCCPEDGTCYW